MSAISLRQEGTWLPADVQTPISLFLGLVGERPGILLESAEVDGRLGRYSLIAWDFRLRLRMKDGLLDVSVRDSRLEGLSKYHGQGFMEGMRGILADLTVLPPEGFADVPPITRSLAGYFGYGIAGILEPQLAPALPPEEAAAGREPCSTVTLPPSTSLQPRSLACVALLVYSLPQR